MLNPGLYERLLDSELQELLAAHPELVPVFEKIDDEAVPSTYSQHVLQAIRGALPQVDASQRLPLVNRLIELLSSQDGLGYSQKRRLLEGEKVLLRQLHYNGCAALPAIPSTPLALSALMTGSSEDPSLEHELRLEMLSADRVDLLVSFIKSSGLSLLLSAFEELEARMVPVRIITTSYMGASDPKAIGWLAERKNVRLRVSYDTNRTRLHAKAYHFHRNSGYSTGYIGSANLSRPAMTSGLEWTVKVTQQDMPHILERFEAEFETYWAQDEFRPLKPEDLGEFENAIRAARKTASEGPRFFLDIAPHAFQQRILDALTAARDRGFLRNLVVAATGTGKTVMAAFDYQRFRAAHPGSCRLLFIVHRKEILHQALDCFRCVLRDANFGELLVGGERPTEWQHVFASIQSFDPGDVRQRFGCDHFDYMIIDEVHHGAASSYRPLFDVLEPKVLLGLTATPERMDGSSILPDFDNEFAAEVRLPEALEEKLLCPFHYFGVTDPVSTAEDRFWRNGRYDSRALEEVYTADDLAARQRLDVIEQAIHRYLPELDMIRAVGFCAGVHHARYMSEQFQSQGYRADYVCGDTPTERRRQILESFRSGNLTFLFVVDLLSEGIDIPEINAVFFLRPTESLTVFLQQLGRGLRHAPEKDCLTVLDFVGQSHRKYRIDRKFSALLRRNRRRIDQEVEAEFPNLPPGCSIQLERVARAEVLAHIKQTLGNLRQFLPEAIRTFEQETGSSLTLGRFIEHTGLSPITILKSRTWSEWKDLAAGTNHVRDEHRQETRHALQRFCLRTDRRLLDYAEALATQQKPDRLMEAVTDEEAAALHYLLWSKNGRQLGVTSYAESFDKWCSNTAAVADLKEVLAWRRRQHPYRTERIALPGNAYLELHAAYGLREITAAYGLSSLETTGPAGTGVMHAESHRTYLHLITFRKEDRDFAPTTRYKDYPISRRQVHWESQPSTTPQSPRGLDLIQFKERGYTHLFFARLEKRFEGITAPFVFLGPVADLVSHEGSRPIRMIWELEHPMPAELFEAGKTL